MYTGLKIKEIVKKMNGGYDLEALLEEKEAESVDRLYNKVVILPKLKKINKGV